MRHRRSNANAVSADLVEYLVTQRGLSQNEIADVLEVDKSFISRVRQAERDFSSRQMSRLAEHLGVPMGAMMIDAMGPTAKPLTGERKELVETCERIMLKADKAIAAARAELAARAQRRAAAVKASRKSPPAA